MLVWVNPEPCCREQAAPRTRRQQKVRQASESCLRCLKPRRTWNVQTGFGDEAHVFSYCRRRKVCPGPQCWRLPSVCDWMLCSERQHLDHTAALSRGTGTTAEGLPGGRHQRWDSSLCVCFGSSVWERPAQTRRPPENCPRFLRLPGLSANTCAGKRRDDHLTPRIRRLLIKIPGFPAKSPPPYRGCFSSPARRRP